MTVSAAVVEVAAKERYTWGGFGDVAAAVVYPTADIYSVAAGTQASTVAAVAAEQAALGGKIQSYEPCWLTDIKYTKISFEPY